MKEFSHEVVHRIAHLARLELSSDPNHAMAPARIADQLNEIFALMEQLKKVDTRDVAPMVHWFEAATPMRDDAVFEQPDVEKVQRLASAVHDHRYLVPTVIE